MKFYDLEIRTTKRWLKLMLAKDILNSGKLAATARIACRTGAILLHFSGEHKVMWSSRGARRHRTQKKWFFSASSPKHCIGAPHRHFVLAWKMWKNSTCYAGSSQNSYNCWLKKSVFSCTSNKYINIPEALL